MTVTVRTLAAMRLVVFGFAIGVAGACANAPSASDGASPGPTPTGELVRVARVVDGDSLVLAGGRQLRLVGINAPERGDPGHQEAGAALEALVVGQRLTLVRDLEQRDRFGRHLGYLFDLDGGFVNLLMVEAGYAQSITVPPNIAHAESLREAERRARENGAGLWRPSDLHLRIAALHWDAPGRDEENPTGEYIDIVAGGAEPVPLRGVTIEDEANNIYRFRDGILMPGQLVRVRSGRGKDSDAERFWGSHGAIWNNDGDTAILRDADGGFIDMHRYDGR